MANCGICKRELDQPADPLSNDCGGDCWGCISEVEAAKAAVVSAQSALDATQAGFEVGTKTILDVLTSQSTLLQAQSSYSQARHQFVLSGLQLREAAGIVATKDLAAVNALLE